MLAGQDLQDSSGIEITNLPKMTLFLEDFKPFPQWLGGKG